MFTVGVSAVTRDPAGRVLLVRTRKAGWELPGGRVEAGETLAEALKREAAEESGCVIDDIGPLSGVYQLVQRRLLVLVYRATSRTPEPRPHHMEEDVLEARWFEPDEALGAVTHEREHEWLADGLAWRSEVVTRAYDRGG
jgi:8-oxo-dGTP diphosphatase